MRTIALTSTLIAAAALAACTSPNTSNQTTVNTTSSQTTTTQSANMKAPAANGVPIAPAHGGGSPTPAPPNPAGGDETGMDTAALDAQIKQAEEKAKAPNATAADKRAAAAAYVERANVFYNAGRPTLYKFALRDYRRALRYEPDNQQAQANSKMIIDIYKSMGRPVPELGNEP